jgi:hypothetical protein
MATTTKRKRKTTSKTTQPKRRTRAKVNNPLTPDVVKQLAKEPDSVTLQEMADRFGVTREAVRQAFRRNGFTRRHAATVRSKSRDEEITKALRKLSRERVAFSRKDVQEATGISRHQWHGYQSRNPLSKAMKSRMFVTQNSPTAGTTKYPKEVCVEAVRRYIASDPEGYTSAGYDKWARTRKTAPSAPFIQKRWKWSEIVAEAGGQAYEPMRKTPYPRMTNEYLESQVDIFFSKGKGWDNRSYATWAQANGAPSLATLRDRLGTWDEIRKASIARIAKRNA